MRPAVGVVGITVLERAKVLHGENDLVLVEEGQNDIY